MKIYDGLLILSIIIALLYNFYFIDYDPRWLMLIFVIIYLFKPYDSGVFKIENKFDVNIPSKLIFSLFLVLATLLIVIIIVSFIFLGYGSDVEADFIVIQLAEYMFVLIASFAIPAHVYMYFLERNVKKYL